MDGAAPGVRIDPARGPRCFRGRRHSHAHAGGRFAACRGEPSMSAAAFGFLMAGVLLNALAQLLLKAGTNATGVLSLDGQSVGDLAWRMATQVHFALGVACYAVSVV